ncbi:MAG TPA: metallophosphoesterase [Candidatus Bariatricus faecipullorum]|nr:metallophosphoesterase [Candidatus Bariatricus faecipullorum]
MRVLIISDTHGRHTGFDQAIDQAGEIDFLIHLGDTEGGEHYIEAVAGCPCYIVAGNNDFFSDMPREMEISLGGYRMFLCHGHQYQVSLGPERIRDEGIARNCDIVMFGHTHRPLVLEEKGITLLNPGSLSFPRQEGRRGSYILMETDRTGKADYKVCYL